MKKLASSAKYLLIAIVGFFSLAYIVIMPTLNVFYGPTTYRPDDSIGMALLRWGDRNRANFKTKWSPYGLTYLASEVNDLDLKCSVSKFNAHIDSEWLLHYDHLKIISKQEGNSFDIYVKIRKSENNPSKFQMALDPDFSRPAFPEYAVPQNFDGGNDDLYCMKIEEDKTSHNGMYKHVYCQRYYEPKSRTLTLLQEIGKNDLEVTTGTCH